jgi:hypothetical protein
MIRTTTMAVLVSACVLFSGSAWADDFFAEANPSAVKKDESKPSNPDVGLQIGLRSGYALPFGKPYDSPDTMRADLHGVVPIWIDVGYRLDPSIYVGAYGAYGFGMVVHSAETRCIGDASCSAYDIRVGVNAQYHLRPKTTVDPWVGLGFGYEWFNKKGSSLGIEFSQALRGFELLGLQVGADFEIDPSVKLGPFIGYSIGQFGYGKVTRTATQTQKGGIDNMALHEWLTFGVRATFNL